MQSFSDEELSEFFSNDKNAVQLQEKSTEAFAYALRSSEGAIGAVTKKLGGKAAQGAMALYEEVCGFFRVLAGKQRSEFYLLTGQLADTREDLALFLSGAEECLRDMV
jgi:hypothetical protein